MTSVITTSTILQQPIAAVVAETVIANSQRTFTYLRTYNSEFDPVVT